MLGFCKHYTVQNHRSKSPSEFTAASEFTAHHPKSQSDFTAHRPKSPSEITDWRPKSPVRKSRRPKSPDTMNKLLFWSPFWNNKALAVEEVEERDLSGTLFVLNQRFQIMTVS